MSFAALVAAEISKARGQHRNIQTIHEGYAVLLEEVDEVWDEVKRRNVAPEALLKEVVQVAAMCQRFAEDCRLVPTAPVAREERARKRTLAARAAARGALKPRVKRKVR